MDDLLPRGHHLFVYRKLDGTYTTSTSDQPRHGKPKTKRGQGKTFTEALHALNTP